MKKEYEIRDGKMVASEGGAFHLYICPDEKEREEIKNSLGILDYDIDAALDPDEISRVEFDENGNAVSIIWKQPKKGADGSFEVSSAGFFFRSDALTIVSREPIAEFTEKDFIGVSGARSFLIRYFFYTIRQYLSSLKAIKQTTGEIEKGLTTSMENKAFLQMFDLSESLVYYQNAIEANGGVLARLRSRPEKFELTERQTALLDDAILENMQCGKQASIYTNVLSGLMDARGAAINNNVNILLRNLTVINVIFLPLTLLASVGGMSEYSRVLDEAGLHWPTGYLFLLVVMSAIAYFTWRLVRHYAGLRK